MEIRNESKNWNTIATGYADFVGPIFSNFINQFSYRLNLSSEMKVLDLACGPGTASLQIYDQVHSIEGLDFSQDMISIFNNKIKQEDIRNITTHVGDGQDLSRFPDNSFDLVISLFGLIFFEDRQTSLKEIQRVLKPNGKILITSWPPATASTFMTTMFAAIQSTGCLEEPKEKPPEDKGTPDPEVFSNELRTAGFSPKKESIEMIIV